MGGGNIVGGGNHVFSPEYDDPANIEDEYGYGSPRRGSMGRRSMGIFLNLEVAWTTIFMKSFSVLIIFIEIFAQDR